MVACTAALRPGATLSTVVVMSIWSVPVRNSADTP